MKSKHDWADDLSNILRTELDESILEAEQGKTITHKEALKQIAEKYNF